MTVLISPTLAYLTYFDTKLSMFGMAPSATEEGGPKCQEPSGRTRRRDKERPNFSLDYNLGAVKTYILRNIF